LIPALILGKAFSAIIMRLTRTLMLEVLRQDIHSHRARERPFGWHHRHAACAAQCIDPVVTLSPAAPVLFGGAVILEQIFVIPGMGLLLLEAVSSRDYPVITGVFLIIGVSW